MTVARIRRSQTVALTVIVDYVCNVPPIPPSASCCLSLYHIVAVICTIDNCDCICYNAVTEGAAESWMAGWLVSWADGLTLSWCVVAAFLLITDYIRRWSAKWMACLSNEPTDLRTLPRLPYMRRKETNRLCILITFYWFSHFPFIYLIYAN